MNEQLNRRLAFLGVLIIGLFAALFTRAWYLQVLTADELSEKARANYVEIVITEPTRGRILDRHGVVLADHARLARLRRPAAVQLLLGLLRREIPDPDAVHGYPLRQFGLHLGVAKCCECRVSLVHQLHAFFASALLS